MAIPFSASRLLAISCAFLAIGAAACGDEKTTASGATSATPSGSQSETTAKPAGDKAQIRALVAILQKAFIEGDGQALCEGLTVAGQRDIVNYGRALAMSGSCADVIRRVAKINRAEGIKEEPTHVVAIRIRGPEAVALVGSSTVAPVKQHYVREGGEWKIESLGLAAAAGVAPPKS